MANTVSEFTKIKKRLAHIVFESDDKMSKGFDLVLLLAILLSVLAAILDSVHEIHRDYEKTLFLAEWSFTVLFTLEYGLRIWLSRNKKGYVFSFYGLIDFLAILPAYLSLIVINTQFLIVVRALRFLRILRILKLGRYIQESRTLMRALKASRIKIGVFIGTVLTLVLVMGTIMFIVEGPGNGFTSIPRSMYWAIVTLTTVGYGDISPITPLGQFIASIIMLLGYGIIAIPTGIVSSEMVRESTRMRRTLCKKCKSDNHDVDAEFCKYCGELLD
ncbi:MAG: ion transporter [Cryomorphaceae bacterium]|nr:ion transporter [Cryomorphaceae bacterium]